MEPFILVSTAVCGYIVSLMVYDPECQMHVPHVTWDHFGDDKRAAQIFATDWAKDEGIGVHFTKEVV